MRRVSVALLVPVAFALAACDNNNSTGVVGRDSVTTPNPPAGVVYAEDFRFRPANITITAGQSVTWTNTSGSVHNVTADDGSFASGALAISNGDIVGGSFSHRFAAAGTFSYRCTIHPQMIGTVVVQ
jgi:plastocyanin